MWYNPTLGVIGLPKQIEINGLKYPASLFRNPSLLEELEIYPVSKAEVDARYYVQGAESRNLVNNVWEFTYAQTDRPLADVKVDAVRDTYVEMSDVIAQLDPLQEKVDRLSSYGLATERQALHDYKKSVYSAFAQRIAEIQACATVNDVKTLQETGVSVPYPTETWLEDIEEAMKIALAAMSDPSDITAYATLSDIEPASSVNKLDSDNALVYADGAQAVRDSSGGWYYTNTGGGNKINWYVYSQDLAADKQSKISDMESIWFDFFPRSDTTRIPFIVVYTLPQGDGNDGASWYRSRFVYELEPAPTPWGSTNGVYGGHIMYVGNNPNVFPQYPHHELTQAGYASAGPQGDDEVVMFFAIGSDSSEGAGGYNFAINSTGSEWNEGSIATVLNGVEPTAAPEVNTTQEDFYRQAVTDMNNALALTDNFITRESEYKKVLPPKITGNGNVNAFTFNLADLYKQASGWREDIMQTTVARFNAIKAGADATAWQAALDDNVFATPTEDAIAQLVDAINNQGTFQTTSDTSDYGSVPVVNSVYQYRLEMIGIVTQQLSQFWMDEQANSTMYREAERIKVGNSSGSYLNEQIIGNPQYETWYKNVVNQFSDKMQAIFDATTYEEADTAFATAINYDGPYAADQRPMPITWTDKTVGWSRRTAESSDPYTALVSARNKLVALGLTDNEALALASYEGDNKRMLDEWV